MSAVLGNYNCGPLQTLITVIGGLIFNIKFVVSIAWSGISSAFSYIWNLVIMDYLTPGYILFPLIAFSLPTLFRLILRFKKPPLPVYIDLYKQDNLFGSKWNWDYGYQDQIIDLWCRCPVCDYDLVYIENRSRSSEPVLNTDFTCERCCTD